jgi:hypothetical protein
MPLLDGVLDEGGELGAEARMSLTVKLYTRPADRQSAPGRVGVTSSLLESRELQGAGEPVEGRFPAFGGVVTAGGDLSAHARDQFSANLWISRDNGLTRCAPGPRPPRSILGDGTMEAGNVMVHDDSPLTAATGPRGRGVRRQVLQSGA